MRRKRMFICRYWVSCSNERRFCPCTFVNKYFSFPLEMLFSFVPLSASMRVSSEPGSGLLLVVGFLGAICTFSLFCGCGSTGNFLRAMNDNETERGGELLNENDA